MEQGPSLNQLIVLRDDDREYRSRVEGVQPGVLTIARPLDLPVEHELGVHSDVLVTWTCERGIAALPTRIIGVYSEGDLPLWSMVITGGGWIEQRRRFVRVPAGGHLTLRLPDDQTVAGSEPVVQSVAGSLVDISEGALRCTVDAAAADDLANDDQVTAAFGFGDRLFAIPARIGFRRATAHPHELAELIVIFDEPVKDADLLRKQVFAQQFAGFRPKGIRPGR